MSEVARAVIEGVVVERDHTRLAQAMLEGTTEFDFAAGPYAIPDELRERLVQWCADLDAWDRATH